MFNTDVNLENESSISDLSIDFLDVFAWIMLMFCNECSPALFSPTFESSESCETSVTYYVFFYVMFCIVKFCKTILKDIMVTLKKYSVKYWIWKPEQVGTDDYI